MIGNPFEVNSIQGRVKRGKDFRDETYSGLIWTQTNAGGFDYFICFSRRRYPLNNFQKLTGGNSAVKLKNAGCT